MLQRNIHFFHRTEVRMYIGSTSNTFKNIQFFEKNLKCLVREYHILFVQQLRGRYFKISYTKQRL